MDDASGDVAVFPEDPDIDINFDDLDGIDFDLPTDDKLFNCDDGDGGGGGGYFVSNDGEKSAGAPRAACFGSEVGAPAGRGSGEESPDSAVTGGGTMESGYVIELERFLMEDDDHHEEEVVGPDGERMMDNFAADGCWDNLLANDETVAAATDDGGDDPAVAAAEDGDDVHEPEDEANSRKRTRYE
ncbi:hypothetical protein GUJ93_ZPchr0004g38178 [Zizania palustris]|uniref:Uncharacterized protein n=1 Tax=Zizania palustris TaxID=103762 RepID=A0A8J5ST77_ZIZPA|nr:hypothetical protein GUJ93_ZPchr0004g38178 [Zizania palustris]